MKQYNFVKIDENEWRFISALEESNSISEISKKLRLPYITVYRTYKQLKDRADLFFSINFQKMNLLPVYLFFDNDTNITHVNEFVVSIRQVYGIKPYKIVYALVPYVYLNNFIKIFDEKPRLIIRGFEFLRWRISSSFAVYLPSEKILLPLFNSWISEIENISYSVNEWKYSDMSPDSIDLMMIMGKYKHPLDSITEVIRRLRKYDSSIPLLSKQLLSYHYRKHVTLYWLYNTVNLYLDANFVPFRLFYFKGREAHIAARILVRLPSFYWALIDINRALVFGQPPGHMFEGLYRILSSFDIDMPLGDLVVSLENISRFIPRLWNYVDSNRWIWRDTRVKVPHLI